MRLGSTAVFKVLREIDATIEVQAAVRIDINVKSPVVSRSIDKADVSCLKEVVCDNEMLLIRGDFEKVGPNTILNFIGIIEALRVVDVGNIKRRDVVPSRVAV